MGPKKRNTAAVYDSRNLQFIGRVRAFRLPLGQIAGLLAIVVEVFRFALVADLAGFRFFGCGLVIRFGPVVAIRAEMPYLAVTLAAIGHSDGRVFEQGSESP